MKDLVATVPYMSKGCNLRHTNNCSSLYKYAIYFSVTCTTMTLHVLRLYGTPVDSNMDNISI